MLLVPGNTGWMRWTAVLVLRVMLVLGPAWILRRRLIFLPDRVRPPSAVTVLLGARDVVLRTDDGQVGACCRLHICCSATAARSPSRYCSTSVPTIVVYGSADSMAPPEQSLAVAAASPRLFRAM